VDALALAEELGAQLGGMKGAGPKLMEFLSMIRLEPPAPRSGGAPTVRFDRVRRVVEQDLDDRIGRLFDDFDEEPFAVSSLGQVHRARTADGEPVAVKVQHPGAAEAVEADLRSLGLLAPLLKRLAPGLDASAVLAEIRERISDELDYELEAQHQRRLARLLRDHPHVRVPRVHTGLSARRVLVSEYVGGLSGEEIGRLGDAERDRAGEIALRVFLDLAWREGVVAGDPHPDNCVLCPDGRLCLLDFGLLRDVDAGYLQGERSPRVTRRPSTPGSSASATCRTQEPSTATCCSSTWRRRASGCSCRASGGSTGPTSAASSRPAIRRARRSSRSCAAWRSPRRRCCCGGWRCSCCRCSASSAPGRTGARSPRSRSSRSSAP